MQTLPSGDVCRGVLNHAKSEARVNAWTIQTTDGIIMIDATHHYSVKDLIVGAMPKVGAIRSRSSTWS
jgi:hypothetical protein